MPKSYHDFARITGDAASSTGVIDSFEDEDLSEYDDFQRSGDKTGFQTSTQRAKDGSVSLDIRLNNEDIWSESGLDTYPERGTTVEVWEYREASDVAMGYYMGMQSDDPTKNYRLNHRVIDAEAIDMRVGDGSELYPFAAGDFLDADVTGEWVRYVVDWANHTAGALTMVAERADGTEIGRCTFFDTIYDAGGWGWESGPNDRDPSGDIHVDYARTVNETFAPVTVTDDFEYGSLSGNNWQGDTGGYQIASNAAKNGTYSLEGLTNNSTIARQNPQYGMSRGDTFEYYIYSTDGNHGIRFGWAFESPDIANQDGYYAGIYSFDDPANAAVRIRKLSGGSFTKGADDTLSTYPTNEWLRVEVDWGSTITATAEDAAGNVLGSASISDTEYEYARNLRFGLGGNSSNPNGDIKADFINKV